MSYMWQDKIFDVRYSNQEMNAVLILWGDDKDDLREHHLAVDMEDQHPQSHDEQTIQPLRLPPNTIRTRAVHPPTTVRQITNNFTPLLQHSDIIQNDSQPKASFCMDTNCLPSTSTRSS